jgi:hypothetical protein
MKCRAARRWRSRPTGGPRDRGRLFFARQAQLRQRPDCSQTIKPHVALTFAHGAAAEDRARDAGRPPPRVMGAFPDGQSALNLAAARLRHIAGTRWSTKRYLNMTPIGQNTHEALTA